MHSRLFCSLLLAIVLIAPSITPGSVSTAHGRMLSRSVRSESSDTSQTWPAWHYSSTDNAYNPTVTAITTATLSQMVTHTVPGPGGYEDVIVGDILVQSGYVLIVTNLATSTILWESNRTSYVPMIYGNVVYFETSPMQRPRQNVARPAVGFPNIFQTDTLVAARAFTGHILWKLHLPKGQWFGQEPPMYINGVIYVVIDGLGELVALNASTGKLLWSRPAANESVYVAGQIGSQTVLYATDGATLMALDPRSGQRQWRWTIPHAEPQIGLMYASGEVYLTTCVAHDYLHKKGHLYVFTSAGKPLWHIAEPLFVSAEAQGVLYGLASAADCGVGCYYPDWWVEARSATTGTVQWKLDDQDYTTLYMSNPTLANGMLFMGTDSGVDVVDPATGQEMYLFDTQQQGGTQGVDPVVLNGSIYINNTYWTLP